MIQIGDIFKVDGNEWVVTKVDYDGVTVLGGRTIFDINYYDECVYVYYRFKNGRTRKLGYTFSFNEIKMVAEIIGNIQEVEE
jgi:hypothetical protein